MSYYANQRYVYTNDNMTRTEVTIQRSYNPSGGHFSPNNFYALQYKENSFSSDYNDDSFRPYRRGTYWPMDSQAAMNYNSTVKYFSDYSTRPSNNYSHSYQQKKMNRRRRNFKKNKPYHFKKIYNDTEARNLAKRLKDVNSINEAIGELCTYVNVTNKQPIYAVLHELFLMDKEEEIKNTKTYCDQSTQTLNLRSSYKREICTPISEMANSNDFETPVVSNKKSVKLEKITPLNK